MCRDGIATTAIIIYELLSIYVMYRFIGTLIIYNGANCVNKNTYVSIDVHYLPGNPLLFANICI